MDLLKIQGTSKGSERDGWTPILRAISGASKLRLARQSGGIEALARLALISSAAHFREQLLIAAAQRAPPS
jgi:hypothetical protein